MEPRKLFSKEHLSIHLDRRLNDAQKEARGVSAEQFKRKTLEDLAQDIASKFHVQPLELSEHGRETRELDIPVDATAYFRHFRILEGDDPMRPGIRFFIEIPFHGNRDFFDLIPDRHDLEYPFGNIEPADRGGWKLVIQTDVPKFAEEREILEQRDKYLGLEMRRIRKYVALQVDQIEKFNTNLYNKVLLFLRQRKAELESQNR